VAIAFFTFASVWKPWIVFACIVAGMSLVYRWLNRSCLKAAYLIGCFGSGFLSGSLAAACRVCRRVRNSHSCRRRCSAGCS
jgi:hypothetical protein